ncbi:MAG: threonine synthase [Clostridia bacterium]|nr:threonine synthase [Clostridia bacterium]
MKFYSTRDCAQKTYSAAQVIKQGLADDGGLFVPESIPSLSEADIQRLTALPYPERAADILGRFLTDYTAEELLADCRAAYSESSFEGDAAPLKLLDNRAAILELWHGPTAAFKDMALQIMPRLLSRALVKTGEKRTALILVATSGDTGKAALEGYKDIDGVKIIVFYPVDGVSTVQKLQMATQSGNNVAVRAIHGNFDDAQTGVKMLFAEEALAKELDAQGVFLSSANSINWGRLAPQIVYYVSAYCDLLSEGKIRMGEEINVCVPTGNFGNIFAAYLAKRMGLPIGKLICASNTNNILTDFLRTGVYDRNRSFYLTMSPSMDILISSNLERLLYFVAGHEKTVAYMKSLKETGRYEVEPEILHKINETFIGYFADEEETAKTILTYKQDFDYLLDTHTAVACSAAAQYRADMPQDDRVTVIASTASPYKFAANVYRSLTGKEADSDLAALEQLREVSGVEITYPLRGLESRTVRFRETIMPQDMRDAVTDFAKQ